MSKAILLTGTDGSGKDTVAEMFYKQLEGSIIHSVKENAVQMYKVLTGIDWNNISGAEKRIHRVPFSNFCEGIKITLGKRVFAETIPKIDSTIIVPDLRFKEEYEVLREKYDVYLFEVKSLNEGSLIRDDLLKHFSGIIHNTEDIEHTEKQVSKYIENFEL